MNKSSFISGSHFLTGLISISIWSLLTWDHFHGGVPSHHLLADDELPAISNWWGGLLLPLLSLFLLYRIRTRIYSKTTKYLPASLIQTVYGFAGALLFGIVLSVFFMNGLEAWCSYMLMGLLPLAVVFPIYRAEYLLGFVLGMTITFGAVLPTGIGSLLILISAVLFFTIRPLLLYIVSKLAFISALKKQKHL